MLTFPLSPTIGKILKDAGKTGAAARPCICKTFVTNFVPEKH
jgi:hypothetical protein